MPADAAKDYYVGPAGKADAAGTVEAPWDILSLFAGAHTLEPGATVWLMGGVYKNPGRAWNEHFTAVRIHGTAEKPIQIRGVAGERAILDGGIHIGSKENAADSCDYTWFRDIEVITSERAEHHETKTAGSNPEDIGGPFGGVNVYFSIGVKCINLIVHDNIGSAFGIWGPAKDTELYGCVMTNNGWWGPDRGHGHCVYAQNGEGSWKTVSNCIASTPFGQGQELMQFYGADAQLVNFIIEDNIMFQPGPKEAGRLLIGGGRPSKGIKVNGNWLYNAVIQIGYHGSKGTNGDCQFNGNVIDPGSGDYLRLDGTPPMNSTILFFKKVEMKNNIFVRCNVTAPDTEELVSENNRFFGKDEKADTSNNAIGTYAPELKPRFVKVKLLPNKYDNKRANLAIFNWPMQKEVVVPVGDFLKDGDSYKLMNPVDLFGKPVLEGQVAGDSITVPMTTEFAAFIVLKP